MGVDVGGLPLPPSPGVLAVARGGGFNSDNDDVIGGSGGGGWICNENGAEEIKFHRISMSSPGTPRVKPGTSTTASSPSLSASASASPSTAGSSTSTLTPASSASAVHPATITLGEIVHFPSKLGEIEGDVGVEEATE